MRVHMYVVGLYTYIVGLMNVFQTMCACGCNNVMKMMDLKGRKYDLDRYMDVQFFMGPDRNRQMTVERLSIFQPAYTSLSIRWLLQYICTSITHTHQSL